MSPLPFHSLASQEQRDLTNEHNEEIDNLLPVLGPLFSLAVILFNIWDHLIDPSHAWLTLGIRLILVALGALAYFPLLSNWSTISRCNLIYWTHVSAIVLAEFYLSNGFLYGLAGICACTFTVTVLTYDFRTFFRILSLPGLLFIGLSYIKNDHFGFINGVMMYLYAIGIASVMLLSIRSFRQKNYAFEQQLLHCTRHDHLTGAINRAYLNELGNHQFALARRHHRTFTICMIDIDHFKHINDTYGHEAGDHVIKTVASVSQQNLREIDYFGRLGGEEFVCILPETALEDGITCFERIRQHIEQAHIIDNGQELRCTVSIGACSLDAHHQNWEHLLRDADTAMYESKRRGKNNTTCFSLLKQTTNTPHVPNLVFL